MAATTFPPYAREQLARLRLLAQVAEKPAVRAMWLARAWRFGVETARMQAVA